MISERFAHLHFPVRSGKYPKDDANIWLLPQHFHQLTRSGDDVKELVGPSNLYVRFQLVGIIRLHDGIEELMHVDGIPGIKALTE